MLSKKKSVIPVSIRNFPSIKLIEDVKLVVGGRSIDGCDARQEDCKCLEDSRQLCHVEWAGHQEAVEVPARNKSKHMISLHPNQYQ